MLALAAIATVTTLSSCSGQCLLLPAPSVFVTVVDSATVLAPASTVTALLFNGTLEEAMNLNVDPSVPPLPNLPKFVSKTSAAGALRVTASASGYRTVVRDVKRVTADGYCGQSQQAQITVRLQPAASP